MKNSVKKFIIDNDMIVRGDTIWVALSGGADSSSLLYILNDIQNEIGFLLKAVHVNHLLRGDESDRDEKFCKKICADYGIELSVYKRDIKKLASEKNMTVEQAGRFARYDIFENDCEGRVALGHNLNDNAETLLMNLLRGSGTTGLCGIKAVSGKYIRPLLKTGRTDIEKFCEENSIQYITDSSNSNTIYFRNAVRRKALPLLNEIAGKDIIPILNRTADSISIDNDYLELAAAEAYSKLVCESDDSVSFENSDISAMHPAISARVVRKAIESVRGNLKDIESRHISLLFNLLENNRTGDAVNLPDRVNALVQFGKTIISAEKIKVDYEYILHVPGKISITEKNLDITAEICDNPEITDTTGDIHYFSLNSCNEGFLVRNRRNGDIIKPWKGRGTVKLKKYFIDRKIDRYKRDELMLIACGNSVAYIQDMDYGKNFIPADGEKAVRVVFERR